jgi:molybdopterin-guanine dinucleotide biosynthesis protein A
MQGSVSKELTGKNISAAIIAGGAGSRTGGKLKAKLLINGEAIISRTIKTLREVFKEIIIVTNAPEEFTEFRECLITADQFTGAGPLGGIHAAMKVSSGQSLFVFAGDMPFLKSTLILNQISYAGKIQADAVIPELRGEIEPLHGIYMTHLVEKLEYYISSGEDLALRSFLSTIKVAYYKPEISDEVLKAFVNINTPEDADKYK